MVSKQIIPINGLSITVYGLQEYNLLPKGTPVAVMFALHGRLQNQAKMEPLAFALCKLNECRQQTDRYLLIVTFDAPNHGTRLLNKTANYGWNEGNDSHALDMWSMIHSTSHTVTELINVLEYYLFGPQKNPVVQVWGVTGFSLGGHASFLSAAKDPRITVAVPIVGIADFLGLMESRLKESNLSADTYLPRPFTEAVKRETTSMDQKLRTKHILIINGEKDQLVKAEFNHTLIQSLRQIHVGKEGHDWGYYLVPKAGHEWRPEMIESTVEWSNRWMVKKEDSKDSKI